MTFKQDYSEYLQSKHWKDLAEETRRLAGYRCQVCNSEDRLEVHHRTYERKGDEHQSDLVCLCHSCHSKYHKEKPTPKDRLRIYQSFLFLNKVFDKYGSEGSMEYWKSFIEKLTPKKLSDLGVISDDIEQDYISACIIQAFILAELGSKYRNNNGSLLD